jgi:hypothetical protein
LPASSLDTLTVHHHQCHSSTYKYSGYSSLPGNTFVNWSAWPNNGTSASLGIIAFIGGITGHGYNLLYMFTIALKLQKNRLKGNIKLSFKSWNNVTRVKLYHLFIWYIVILLLRPEIVLLLSTFYIYINIIIHYISRILRISVFFVCVVTSDNVFNRQTYSKWRNTTK